MLNSTPTGELYDELMQAFNHFNRSLFGDVLPGAVITLQRDRKSYGYFCGGRFVRRSGEQADEIAMNPSHFAGHPVENTLSTLAHEMAHQWQHHHGKPGRRSYHNKEWADRMVSIGLMPSHTGAPDGKRTGEKIDHYIIEDGPFAVSCAALLKTRFMLNWLDRFAVLPTSAAAEAAALAPELVALGIEPAKPGKRMGNRVKYRCDTCKMQAWGKPGLPLLCGTCDARPLEAVEEDPDAV